MIKLVVVVALLGCISFCLAQFCPGNLLVDGSFETACTATYCTNKVYTPNANANPSGASCRIGYGGSPDTFAPGSWIGTNLDVQTLNSGKTLIWRANNGACFLDTSGNAPSTVYQNFTLTSLSNVTITFAAASSYRFVSSLNFQVYNSEGINQFSAIYPNLPTNDVSASDGGYRIILETLPGLDAGEYSIRFSAVRAIPSNNDAGPYIDSVCVTSTSVQQKVLGAPSAATCPNTVIEVALEANNYTSGNGMSAGQFVSAILTVDFQPGAGYTTSRLPPNVICQITPENLDFVKGGNCVGSVAKQDGISYETVICDFSNYVTVQHRTARVALEFITGSIGTEAVLNAICTAQCSNLPTGTADFTFGTITEAFEPVLNDRCSAGSSSDFVVAENQQVDLAIRRADGNLFACPDATTGRLIDVCSVINADRYNALAGSRVCSSTPTGSQIATFVKGWDDFTSTGTTPTVTWSITGTTFKARLFLPGDNQARQFGLHFEALDSTACSAAPYGANTAFGSITYNTGFKCTSINRQSVSRNVVILDLTTGEVVSTPTAGGYEATIIATGVQPGTYDFQFTVRKSAGDLSVFYQSGTTFGNAIRMVVCDPSP